MEFESFGKIPRLVRDCVITEKIDGTNAQIYIDEHASLWVGSRSIWIYGPDVPLVADNHGFRKWVLENRDELVEKLGPGRHFGEWWGQGIQRGYGLKEKRFSLFNTHRWTDDVRPACCHVVPILYEGIFDSEQVCASLSDLDAQGSYAAPGFMKPEGVVIFHKAANMMFKQTLEKDEEPKCVSHKSNGTSSNESDGSKASASNSSPLVASVSPIG